MWPRRPTTRSQIPKTRRPTIRIREIVEADDPALTRAYELLSTSFLREERVTLDTWHASLAERSAGLLTDIAWHLFVAEQDEDVVGLASGTYLGNAASCSRTRAISSSSRSSEGRRRTRLPRYGNPDGLRSGPPGGRFPLPGPCCSEGDLKYSGSFCHCSGVRTSLARSSVLR